MNREEREGTAVTRRRLACALAVLGALVLGACGDPPEQPLAVGLNAWVGYDPLVLARDRGFIDPARVKVVELASGAEVQRSLRNGLLDVAAVTLDEVMRLNEAGMDMRVVAVLDTSAGADKVVAHPSITAPADLRDQFVAVEDSSVGALMLQRMLQLVGLTRADIKVVNMESSQHLGAQRQGRVAAAVTYEPVAGPLLEAGFVTIFDSTAIPGEIIDVLAVRQDVLTARPQAVDDVLRAWDTGLRQLQADPASAADALSRGTDLSPADYRTVLQGLRFVSLAGSLQMLQGTPPAIDAQARSVARALVDIGALASPPEVARVIDVAPLQRVLAAQPAEPRP
jgi:NitT/TauT family transport system substrate-binding protein